MVHASSTDDDDDDDDDDDGGTSLSNYDDYVFPHLANSYANPVKIGLSSIDLSVDEDTKSNEEDNDERMREATDSAIRRTFKEDESRRNASLAVQTATRVMEGWSPRILYWTKAPNSKD
ncbi:ribosome biogenesis protein ERB1-like [Camellia sinensis]|uniref:ribosome biogenesis protein ERB1-like n=1 Tax=Camellia sinensis TaxID=4442 RepID=UPI00103698F2|nr:ribosome biogenesis protein ERB1-like [Camellia sinensis]